jgi:PAS domain S-box-containing protein
MTDSELSTTNHVDVVGSATAASDRIPSPGRLWLITTLTVFAGEVIVMVILSALPPLPVLAEAMLDGLMITAIATPALYFLLYRPMDRHITRRRAAEDALIELNEELEERVSARTVELKHANDTLLKEVEERRRAEQDLLKTNEFVQKVVESAPCMLLIFDAESMSCTYVNSAVTELLGYTPDQVQLADREFFAQILDEDDRDRLGEIIRSFSQEEAQPVIARFELHDARGEHRPFRVRISVFATTPLTEPELILLSAIDLGRDPS